MARILVFGDSIVYGAWDEEGGWVQRLKQFLNKKNLSDLNIVSDLIYNLGVDRDTTEGLLKRVEFEIPSRMWEKEETIIIFAVGSNDCDFVHSKNDFLLHPAKFKKNIKILISIAQKFSSKIIFVEYTPVDEFKTSPMLYDADKSSKNEYIQKYNQIVKQVCQQNSVYFIEVFDDWIKMDYKELLEDGIHPNSAGHEKIFETVKDFLIKNKIL